MPGYDDLAWLCPKSSTTVTHDKNDGGQGQNGESVRSSRKRPRPRNDGESENDESPERPGGRPRLNPPQPDPTALNLLLACPFWKQDSRLWRECFRYKLKRIRDLKQHLRRNHGKVCYCVRCGEEFENPGDLDLHYNQDVPCAKAAFQVKWLSEPQKKELRENRANPKLSVEKQWYEIWDIVFPEAPKPDSPYLDASISEDLSSFREFFLQQGPEIIRQTAENQGLLPGLIAIQERQFYQTFLARIYDRWASSRGHAQYPVDSSHLDHDDRISQEVPEPDSSLTLGGSVEEEPSIPPGIHVLSEGPHQEQQIGSRTSDSHDNQHYDYGEYVNESPNTDEPSAGALNANSSFNGLEELMIYTDGVPPIQSRNSEASSQEPISAIQNHNLQNYDGWSGLGDFTSYQGGHLHVLEDVPEGSSFHDQRIVAPVRTISSTPEDRNPPDTQSDSMRETLLHDLDVHSLDFLDDFPWDGNMNVNNSGSQLDPEGELRPSRNQA
ncbi:hypothetical protein B0T21DRAFT_411364 [Apiosordaria backusii]|uniref:C2H2-type domain-containing protein n=1 Tax=Apiosordaria backusii TaxID=314023 RepID=A0AA40BL12_9PEZI|nr:hypothetical protein B0T21DRAFT_411364 [Apiosordaria backusii]